MNIEQFREKVGGKLIVSCQALPEEPLHSSFIMGRMAGWICIFILWFRRIYH